MSIGGSQGKRTSTKPVIKPSTPQPVENLSALLTCETTNAERILWQKDQGSLPSGAILLSNNRTLSFTKISHSDSGHYECEAVNRVSASKSALYSLTVNYVPSITDVSDPCAAATAAIVCGTILAIFLIIGFLLYKRYILPVRRGHKGPPADGQTPVTLYDNVLDNTMTHKDMEKENQTEVLNFILIGITDISDLQTLIFLVILFIYLLTLGGNMTILLLVSLDPHLHTPMYFFLGNLSVIDMSSTTFSLHKIFSSYISGDNTISFFACMTQIFMFLLLTADELLILTAMSYDRYVAICKPLHYTMIMSSPFCVALAAVCWLLGFGCVTPYLVVLSSYTCYRSNIINHFYCDLVPLLKLTCNDTTTVEIIIVMEGLFFASFPFSLTILSYIFIITTILKIRSSTGRQKAFHTCSSHLTVVVLLYITLFCLYLRPTSTGNMAFTKIFSLINTVAVPVLNPLIYSLKNKDVKSALRRQLRCCEDTRFTLKKDKGWKSLWKKCFPS
ncbi:olfactory receptor 6C1-like [Discoglossus pictus]